MLSSFTHRNFQAGNKGKLNFTRAYGGLLFLISFLAMVSVVLCGSKVFNVAGPNTFTFPAGVVTAKVQLWGAGGGGGAAMPNAPPVQLGSTGGGGAYVECVIDVSGKTLGFWVGEGGKIGPSPGSETGTAFGGGGQSKGDSQWYTGGGGGRSAIVILSGSNVYSPDYVTAGGGGGGGARSDSSSPGYYNGPLPNNGGNGGGGSTLNGGNGMGHTLNGKSCFGKGGGTTTGGAGGTSLQTGFADGNPGGVGTGGNAAQYGGAGGGGFYGGGSGSNGLYDVCAGGGGSSYTFNCLSDVYTEPGTTDANDLTTAGRSKPQYIAGVGVGGAANTVAGGKPSAGGPGLIVVTWSEPPTVFPTVNPSTVKPSTATPSISPSILSSSVVIPILPPLPKCPEGWTLHATCEWTYGGKRLYQDASPASSSNDSYQFGAISAIACFLSGMMVMGLFTAVCILPSKDYARRAKYMPINESG